MSELSVSPILEYMFNTLEEAINQAKIWGYDGYRTYLINGVLKYVPCSNPEDYLRATRLYIHQGAIVAQGKEVWGDKLVGYQFTDKDTVQGDPIYTLGNFSITTTLTEKENIIFTLADSKRGYSGIDFTLDGIEALKAQVAKDVTAKVRFDKTNLEKYVTYASLRERFRVCLQEINEIFPAAMHVVPYSIDNTTVYDYHSYLGGTAATFKIRLAYIDNPFNIDYFRTGLTAAMPEYTSPLRNFGLQYKNYEIYYKNVSYKIIDIITPTSKSDSNGLVITVDGDPFLSDVSVNGTANINFFIKPNRDTFNKFYETATDLAAYLLNAKSNPLYLATFNVPHRLEDNTYQVINQSMQFPMYDMFNVDLWGDKFDVYINDLNFIADEFDRTKMDLIARFLTTESLQEFDTDDRRAYVIMQTYGSMFDSVRQYVDGIAYMTNVSYDKIDNIPDVLLKNFAHTLGWKTYEIEKDDSLIESLFSVSVDRQGDDTPQEIDMELWRRILINSFYIFKSKGTRKSLEFALELVGIPIEIMDINEYVYVADHPLDYAYYYSLFNTLIANYPVDESGYPTTPSLYFQAYGGNMLNDAQNVGPYDGGKAYIDAFRSFDTTKGFNISRVIDNKKSWIITTGETDQTYDLLLRNTNYSIKDSRLIINSKEADAFISTQMTFDYYVYSFYANNNYKIYLGSTEVIDPEELTFNDYLRDVLAKLINPQNRKVIRKYPVLSKIYWDYLQYAKTKGLASIDYKKTLGFLSKFDTYWVKLLQQFVPATTIFMAGKKIRNAEITRDKFQYKHGLNPDKDWMGTDGSEFQVEALKPSPIGELNLAVYSGSLGQSIDGRTITFQMEASLSEQAKAFLNRSCAFDAQSCDYYRRYADVSNLLEEPFGNYGSMTGLTSANALNLILYEPTNGAGAFPAWLTYDWNFNGTYNDNQFAGTNYYAGFLVSGKTDTTTELIVVPDELPKDENDSLYPLRTIFFCGLHGINNLVDIDTEYTFEADILFNFNVSGKSEYSYIGLVPVSGATVQATILKPSHICSNFDMLEGCQGEKMYDKYNWVHLKTKFRTISTFQKIALVGYDIYYNQPDAGYNTISIKNITIVKAKSCLDFDTPPPIPHTCYYDEVGQTVTPLDPELLDPEFCKVSPTEPWSVAKSGCTVSLLTCPADLITIIFTGSTGYAILKNPITPQIPPTPNNTLYRITLDVQLLYTGELSYSELPTIYLSPFDGTIYDYKDYPFKFKGTTEIDGSSPVRKNVSFEAYYYYGDSVTTPTCKIAIDCQTTAVIRVKLKNLSIDKVNLYYIDETGELSWYKQPHYFGYSKNIGTSEQDYSLGGLPNEWVIPYLPLWGTPENSDDQYGKYEEYGDLTATFPLMHVNPTYVNKFDVGVDDKEININLTNSCGLKYKFHPKTLTGTPYPIPCITPRGITMDNQICVENGWEFTIDGFYPTTGTTSYGLGPIYTPQSVYGLYAVAGNNNLMLTAGMDNNVREFNNYATSQYAYGTGGSPIDRNTGNTSSSFVQIFNATSDWGRALDQRYSIIFTHNLGSVNLIMEIWDETTGMIRTDVDKIENIDINHTKISVHEIPDLRFAGRIIIYKSGADPAYESWSELPAGWVNIHDVPRDFNSSVNTVGFGNRSNGQYFIVNRYSLLKVEASLIYDSPIDTEQVVYIKLMGADNLVYDQQAFTVGGSNNAQYTSLSSRTLSYNYEGYFSQNDEIYLILEPSNHDCYINTEEEIRMMGGYVLSGGTGSTFSYIQATSMLNTTGGTTDTYFTGDTYQFMYEGVYDVLRFIPTGVSGYTSGEVNEAVYDFERSYYMAFVSGATAPNAVIALTTSPIDVTQYNGDKNKFIYGVIQTPPPFTGVTWYTYTDNGEEAPHYSSGLTGNTFSILHKSYVKIYESDISGINIDDEDKLIAFWFNENKKDFRYGYSKNFFDNAIERFYVSSDYVNREVFHFGTSAINIKKDGVYLTYTLAQDAAGYPLCGEFIGKVTAKDPCGNFATTFILICVDLKSDSRINKLTNYMAVATAEIRYLE